MDETKEIKINEETLTKLEEKMRERLEESNNGNNEKKEIDNFLESSLVVLFHVGNATTNMKKKMPRDEKMKAEIFGIFLNNTEVTEEQKNEIKENLENLDQWIFMNSFLNPTNNLGLDISPKDQRPLRKARGKFTSWDKWEENADAMLAQHSTKIPNERFNVTSGFGCPGDSGGGLISKNKDGRYVVVGVASQVMFDHKKFPPSCWCNCEDLPEIHTRVIPYIQ